MSERTNPGRRADTPIFIKKYANRRLYNTATSSYVTLDHLARMVKDGVEFTVAAAKTGEDLTRSVLTQIIVEEEAKGESLLPIGFLRQLIGFYGDSLQGLLPRYLESSMSAFARNQEQMRRYINDTMGGMMPFSRFEDMGRQNAALFENAMRMFTPFAGARAESAEKPDADAAMAERPGAGKPDEAATSESAAQNEIKDFRAQLDSLQRKVDDISSRGG